MKNKILTLSDEIKKNIRSRVMLCVLILAIAHIISISFYIYFFTEQTKRQLNDISKDLTPYIISQEIIGNRYAIDLKIKEIEESNNIRIKWIKYKTKQERGLKFSNPLIWKYTVPVVAIDNKYYGYYEMSGYLTNDPWIALGLFIQLLFLIIFLIIIRFILYPIANDIPKKIFVDPINNLIHLLDKNNKNEIDSFIAPAEILLLRDRFIEILSKQNEILKKTEIVKISEQVAHDIRSPLAAINIAISDVSFIPENKRIIIKSASQRINDIANNLLSKSKNINKHDIAINSKSESLPELIFTVIENIVSEKRYEYFNSKLNIQLHVSDSSYTCFSLINLALFKRVLSNLLNNSIEATQSDGCITIHLSCDEQNVTINIQDNGCGIPPEILPRLMEPGFSFNKKNGAGIGLAYAKQYIEQINGKISIHSVVSQGTQVTITLPRTEFPDWFCAIINIDNKSNIIILDDDQSIHKAWDEKFSHLTEINLLHFYKASDLIESNHPIADLYLIDHELFNGNINGLSVIENLHLNQKAILVTSCFEDNFIRKECTTIGVNILPKPIVPYIPIKMITTKDKAISNILIDDDELIRDVWMLCAKQANINLFVYASIDEFQNEINLFSKNVLIYIDSHLSGTIKGELYAKKLYEMGFKEIYLTTGFQPDYFTPMPWIKAIVGKEPPFIGDASPIEVNMR